MTPEFDKWWDNETSIEPHPTNNYRKDSAAYWAYQGWMYGVAAEREACAQIAKLVAREIDDTNGTATYIAAAIRAQGDA